VRVFDAATLAPRARLEFPWAVNFSTLRPESGAPGGGAAAAVVGDDPDVVIADLLSGQTALRLKGHRDFAFAAAWHPGGTLLATGNQDATTMVWDVRAPGAALAVLPARLGAVRALRWSGDGRCARARGRGPRGGRAGGLGGGGGVGAAGRGGPSDPPPHQSPLRPHPPPVHQRFLVAAEPADYVHIYEMDGGAAVAEQEVDLFGEISGVSLSPCGSMLFVGVSGAARARAGLGARGAALVAPGGWCEPPPRGTRGSPAPLSPAPPSPKPPCPPPDPMYSSVLQFQRRPSPDAAPGGPSVRWAPAGGAGAGAGRGGDGDDGAGAAAAAVRRRLRAQLEEFDRLEARLWRRQGMERRAGGEDAAA
jgi:hypothetical protein